MSSVVISGDTSGSVTLSAPAVAGSTTLTLPAATGTVMVSGNMPAFSAYGSSVTSLSNTVYTKISFDAEEFDTNNNFASNRFTPTVAGYYQVSGLVGCGGTGEKGIAIYKNGARFKDGADATTIYTAPVSALIYCNGSTDYVEIYFYQATGGTVNTYAGANNCYFQAVLVRTA